MAASLSSSDLRRPLWLCAFAWSTELSPVPQERWFRQFMREFLKASPTVKINVVLAEWAKALDEGKQGG